MNVLIVDAAGSPAADALNALLTGHEVQRYPLDFGAVKQAVSSGDPVPKLPALREVPVLLVNAHPAGVGHLADAWGLVWLEQLLASSPEHLSAVLWSVDPHLAKRRLPYRASRLPDPGVEGYAVKLAPPSEPGAGNVVLWDPLSNVTLEDALKATADTVAMSDEQRATVRNAPLVRALSRERHRLGNVASALRIIEGAWLNGWVSGDQLSPLREVRRELHWPNEARSIVDEIGRLEPHGGAEPCRVSKDELLLICDDHPFWEATLKLVWQGGNVEQVRAPEDLMARLDKLDKGSSTATVLLDLHFEDGPISAKTLATISEHPATNGLVLFTGDTTDGVLLREVYERGHTCFFKELSGPRDPSAYAARLAETLRAAVAYAPLDVVAAYLEALWQGPMEEDLRARLRGVFATWKRTRLPHLLYALSGLLEQRLRAKTSTIRHVRKENGTLGVWILVAQDAFWRPDATCVLAATACLDAAREVRNHLAHELELPVEPTEDNAPPEPWHVAFALLLATATWVADDVLQPCGESGLCLRCAGTGSRTDLRSLLARFYPKPEACPELPELRKALCAQPAACDQSHLPTLWTDVGGTALALLGWQPNGSQGSPSACQDCRWEDEDHLSRVARDLRRDPKERVSACRALLALRGPEALVPELNRAIQNRSLGTSGIIISALRKYGETKTVLESLKKAEKRVKDDQTQEREVLNAAIRDVQERVCRHCAATSAAPKRVAAPAPVPAASSAAAAPPRPSPLGTAMARETKRSAMIEAIKTLAKEGSIADLITVLSDCPNNTGKTEAAVALGKLGHNPRSVAALEAARAAARAAGNDCLAEAANAALRNLGADPPQP